MLLWERNNCKHTFKIKCWYLFTSATSSDVPAILICSAAFEQELWRSGKNTSKVSLFVVDFGTQPCCWPSWQEEELSWCQNPAKPRDHRADTESSSAELRCAAQDCLSHLCSGTKNPRQIPVTPAPREIWVCRAASAASLEDSEDVEAVGTSAVYAELNGAALPRWISSLPSLCP